VNVPVEIIAALLSIAVAGALASQRAMWKRIVRTEKNVLILIIMLRDRGFQIPDQTDTEIFIKSNNL